MKLTLREMSAEEALALAKFQRPGVRLIVGATRAREVLTEARTPESIAYWRRKRGIA